MILVVDRNSPFAHNHSPFELRMHPVLFSELVEQAMQPVVGLYRVPELVEPGTPLPYSVATYCANDLGFAVVC